MSEKQPNFFAIGSVIKARWKITSKIGQGAFGQTYTAFDLNTHENVAIKVESVQAKKQVLKLEVAILKKLQDSPYFCRFISCGHVKSREPDPQNPENTKAYNYVVMQLLGQNLSDLRKRKPDNKFSLSTTALLIKQMLTALETMHDKGYIHRDVKPSNFAVGLERVKNEGGVVRPLCYMFDFGLSRRYLTANNKVREPRVVAGFRGTARYASLNAHKCRELGRRDDLWSVFYLMVEFLSGQLPWRKEKDKDVVGEIKERYTNETLVASLPKPCQEFYKYLLTLNYSDRPNYKYLHSIVDDLFVLSGDPNDVAYDWERLENEDVTESGVSMGLQTSATAAKAVTSMKKESEDDGNEAMIVSNDEKQDHIKKIESDVHNVSIKKVNHHKPPSNADTLFNKLRRSASDIHQKLSLSKPQTKSLNNLNGIIRPSEVPPRSNSNQNLQGNAGSNTSEKSTKSSKSATAIDKNSNPDSKEKDTNGSASTQLHKSLSIARLFKLDSASLPKLGKENLTIIPKPPSQAPPKARPTSRLRRFRKRLSQTSLTARQGSNSKEDPMETLESKLVLLTLPGGCNDSFDNGFARTGNERLVKPGAMV